ncbi:rhomboid family intramembrane serine protease [Geobacter sp. SVR]|uniref:rhomboid family intramembrane serine protease n=1 Tax=Geobacter sp. SVR TaxID=2495594 RepID=UPI00143F029C|nr:rhomboid family intramembrane serine protease [Geobacter sp. SVR]BCS55743.1 rhomboid family intramembrane serine protease [Geobacter sp. SVR]GCF83747.1 rhomboid family intramembrane serine protease [Geobacter sp. SVR]
MQPSDSHIAGQDLHCHWVEIPPWRIRGTLTPLKNGQAGLWQLVLEARGFPCHLEPGEGGWRIMVPSEQLDACCLELSRFEEENRDWPPQTPQVPPLMENTLTTFSVLLLVAIFHNLIRLDLPLPGLQADWMALGSARAALIRQGEWWRAVTALTLHADWLHLAGNLAIGGMFITFLSRELGSGLSWSLLVVAGAFGNLANAWLQPPGHDSVGASTAVFAAVGILAALNLVRYRRLVQRRRLVPVAAALALLALLGTEGRNTDLGAHLFGFVAGIAWGYPAEWLLEKFGRPGRISNILLGLSSTAIMLTAWWLALSTAGTPG